MTQQLLVKSKTIAYYLVKSGATYTLTQITDSDYPSATVRGCAFFDGRFFVMTPAGEIYQSALEDASAWSALEFIQSQAESDAGVYLARINGYLVALKTSTTEFFYDAANPVGSILAPVQNATFQIGCAHEDSVKEMAGTIVWMGQTREGFGRSIYRLNGQSPEKISTPQVDKILNSDNLATVYSWAANVGAHLLYGLTLVTSGVSLIYDFNTQLWSFFTSLVSSGAAKTISAITADGVATSTAHGFSDGAIVNVTGTNSDFNDWHVITDVTTDTFRLQATGSAFSGAGSAQLYTETYFPISSSIRCGGKQYMQHATNGTLYEFSQSAYTDAATAIASRIRTPKVDLGDVKAKFMAQAELVGDKIDSMAAIRYTDDDFVTYSDFRNIDLIAPRSRIRRLGKYLRRAFEIIHVKNALFRMEALEIDTTQ